MRQCKTCVYYEHGPGFDPNLCHYDPPTGGRQNNFTTPDNWCRHWTMLMPRTEVDEAIKKLEWATADTTQISLAYDAVVDALNLLRELNEAT